MVQRTGHTEPVLQEHTVPGAPGLRHASQGRQILVCSTLVQKSHVTR
jgi:hypothetical protein